MKKRRIGTILIFCILLGGCHKGVGSFKEGNVNMEYLYQEINHNISNQTWDMALLDDQFWNDAKIEKQYQLDMTKVKSGFVKSSIIAPQISEIALFEVTKENEQSVKNAVMYRLSALEEKWGTYVPECKKLIKEAQQGRIGKYYYVIIGEDHQKVVNYILNKDK